MLSAVCLVLSMVGGVVSTQGSSFNHTQEALNDLVTLLPGIKGQDGRPDNTLDFNLFSGFLEITSTNFLYYSFVESQRNPITDPLIIWTNAGPGCSGMVSFFTEFGPFSIISPANDNPTPEEMANFLEMNPHSWSRLANILYLEQPIGVGYSHTTRNAYTPDYSDHLSALDNMLAVEAFFKRYPALEHHDIYLASESYGGHFTVQLLEEIYSFSRMANEKRKDLYRRIKGVVVGNPFVDFNTGVVARAEALWGLQLIPAFEWRAFRDAGCVDIQTYFEYQHAVNSCQVLMDRLITAVGRHVDLYNVNYDVCTAGSSSSQTASISKQEQGDVINFLAKTRKSGGSDSVASRQFALTLDRLGRRLRGGGVADQRFWEHPVPVPTDDFDDDIYMEDDDAGVLNLDEEERFEACTYHYMTSYLNRPDVKAALHVPMDISWYDCNEDIQALWPLADFYGSSLSNYEAIIHRNLAVLSRNSSEEAGGGAAQEEEHVVKVLVYSGDNDIICPTVGTQRWVFGLPHEPVSLWRPWYFTNRSEAGGVGGAVTQFNSSMTLVTLHEGGHMVAAYQPRQAYDMMKTFLHSDDFFTPPEEVKVLKLYYSLTLEEYREDKPHLEVEGEASAELGSDVGYEFVRDAVRHCLFEAENITISGKLVDIFAIKVHHSYEVSLDAVLGGEDSADNVGHVPVDDDFLQLQEEQHRRASMFSFEKDAIDGNNWDGLVYDRREVVVISVEVVVATFDHLYDLKTELDVAFDTALYNGHLQKMLRKALHAHHELHDSQGTGDDLHPYSDILTLKLDDTTCESKEWFSADIAPLSKRQDFDFDKYRNVWALEDSYGDDDIPAVHYETQLEWLEYSAVNLGIALVTSSATVMLVAGTFISYRHYHDSLMRRLGYEIQDDFDSLLGWGEDDEEDGSVVNPVQSGVELTTEGGRGRGGSRGSAFMQEDDEGGMSALRI